MGYETTVYIVDCFKPPEFIEDETPGAGEKKTCWMGMDIAKVELCKIGGGNPLSDLFDKGRRRNKKTGHYPYAEYQERYDTEGALTEEIAQIKDCYGDPLGHHKGVDVLQALERTIAHNLLEEEFVYRRFEVLRATLKIILATFPPDNIWVLTYGH